MDAIRRKKLLEKYGTGESGFLLDEEIEKKWKDDFGTNAELSEYTGKNPTVKTIGGTYIGKADKSGVRFLGIPYAEAPMGENRWKKPVPVAPSDKIYEAYYFGNVEIQPESEHNILNRFKQDEDCLNLNIWTKALTPDAKKPVLVYFHGGDGRYGGSASPTEHLKNLAGNVADSVCVSVNYRIGVFGTVDFGEADSDYENEPTTVLPLLDQIEALKWIKANISAFGGDPENVTLAGESSGGSCIILLSAAKEAKGLFKRAIIMCASTIDTPIDSKKAAQVGNKLFEEFNAKNVSDLKSVTKEQLKKFTGDHYDLFELPPRDGKLVPTDIDKAFEEGVASDIEFIIGIAADEVSGWQAMVAGDVELDEMIGAYYQNVAGVVGSEKLNNILKKYIESGLSETKAKRLLLADFHYKTGILHDCRTLAKGGSKVKVFYWDVKGDIEELKANSISMVTTILGNSEIAEQLGYLNDRDVTEIMQSLIGKYIHGQEPALYNNEIKGVKDVTWDDFAIDKTNVLHVEKGRMSMDNDAFSENVLELEKAVWN